MKTYRPATDDITAIARGIWAETQWGGDVRRALFFDTHDNKLVSDPVGGANYFKMCRGKIRFILIGTYDRACEPDWIKEDIIYELKKLLDKGIPSSLGRFVDVMRHEAAP